MIAYLDAGSLGLIFTAIAGGAAGVAMLFRMYGNKFLGIFSKKHRERARSYEAELRGPGADDELEATDEDKLEEANDAVASTPDAR